MQVNSRVHEHPGAHVPVQAQQKRSIWYCDDPTMEQEEKSRLDSQLSTAVGAYLSYVWHSHPHVDCVAVENVPHALYAM